MFTCCQRMIACNRSSAANLQRGSWQSQCRGSVLPLDEWSKLLLRKSSSSMQWAFDRTQSPSLVLYNCALVSVKGFRPPPLPAFLSGSQSVDSASFEPLRSGRWRSAAPSHPHWSGRSTLSKSSPTFRTSAKPMGSLASGQSFQLALQSLLLVFGYGQLVLRNILFVSQLFQFFIHGQLLLSDNEQNKSDQLFTTDRLWLGHYFVFPESYIEW